jgi:hypothetical protein
MNLKYFLLLVCVLFSIVIAKPDIEAVKATNDEALKMLMKHFSNGAVPYNFDANSGYNRLQKEIVVSLVKGLEKKSNFKVKFMPKTSESRFLKFKNENNVQMFDGSIVEKRSPKA